MAPLRAYVALATAQVFVGSLVVVGKVITTEFPIFVASTLRSMVGVIVLLPLLLWVEGRMPRLTRRDLLFLVLIAFTGMFMFSVFLLYGLRLTSATESGIVISTAPAILGLCAFLFLREPFTRWRALAIGLAVAGMVALRVSAGAEALAAPGSWLGMLLVFGAATGEALFTALGKPVSRSLSALAIATYVNIIGLLMFLPFGLAELPSFRPAEVPLIAWAAVLYYGVFITAGAFLLWYWAMAQVPASTAAVFLGILPISGVLLSYGLLGETFRWGHVFGLAAVLAGIACITLPAQPAEPVRAEQPRAAPEEP